MQKKIINYEKKEMIPLTDEKNRSYFKQEVFRIYKKEFITDIDNSSKNMFIKYKRSLSFYWKIQRCCP